MKYRTCASVDSHYMIALGTVLQVFSMVMLSFAHENQYYQVCALIYFLYAGRFHGSVLGFPRSGSWNGNWPIPAFSSIPDCHWTPFQIPQSTSNGNSGIREYYGVNFA